MSWSPIISSEQREGFFKNLIGQNIYSLFDKKKLLVIMIVDLIIKDFQKQAISKLLKDFTLSRRSFEKPIHSGRCEIEMVP